MTKFSQKDSSAEGRRLNPFPNYYYRFAFDMLMLAGGLSLIYIGVELGVLR